MISEKIGILTPEEQHSVVLILEKKWALQELLKALDSQPYTIEEKKCLNTRIEGDLAVNQSIYEKWISTISQKKHWQIGNKEKLRINFDTSEVFILKEVSAVK